MENKDKEYMRFLAACFAMTTVGNAKMAVKLGDELLEELEGEKEATGGIVDIVPKRKRTRAN
jgi:DNA-directed RNA polymerase subunit F